MYRKHVLPAAALSLIAMTGAGCGDYPTRPTRPARQAVPPPTLSSTPVPYVDPGFPPAASGAEIYGRTSPSSTPGSQRYVFHENGRLGLQYLGTDGTRFFEYEGSYSRTGTGAHIVLDANNGLWQAEATMDGDLLVVRYNLEATMDDFEDGIYVRQPTGQ